jgi:tetratricopeptide (TPR) repeat protein
VKTKTVSIALAAWAGLGSGQSPCLAAGLNSPTEAISAKAKTSYNQGLNLEYHEDWRGALSAFLKSVAVQPKLASAWIELGKCYFELHDYKHAEQCYRYAYEKLALRRETLRSSIQQLIRCEEKNGELEAIQQTRREYVAKFPNASDMKTVSDQITFYDRDFASTRQVEAAGKPSGYIFRPWLQGGVPKMPIKVSISASKLMSPSKTYTKTVANRYANLARKAFLAWATVSNGKVIFDFVADPAAAQINCEWTNNLKERVLSFSGGHCETLNITSFRSQKQRPLIFVGANLIATDTEFYNACLHEIGHALGLGHSSHPQDVMYSSERPHDDVHEFAVLSKNDVDRVTSIYTYPDQAAQVALEFGSVAFIDRDYQAAYDLLSEKAKSEKSMEQFQKRLEGKDRCPVPDSLEITEISHYYPRNQTIFYLRGRNQKNERSDFVVVTVQMPDGVFKIDDALRNPY